MIEDLAMPQVYYSELEFRLFNCLDKYAEGTKLSWNVLNSGNFLDTCWFWTEIFNNSFVVQASNSVDIPFIGEDLEYCILVKQIINIFFKWLFYLRTWTRHHFEHEEIQR